MGEQVYAVCHVSGEYDDYIKWPLFVCRTREEADRAAGRMTDLLKQRRDKAPDVPDLDDECDAAEWMRQHDRRASYDKKTCKLLGDDDATNSDTVYVVEPFDLRAEPAERAARKGA